MIHHLTDQEFDALISKAMDELPQDYIIGLKNVAILMEDTPSEAQKEKMHIDNQHLLLGLYEGIPLTQRGNGWSGMLPDRITLFKQSLLQVSRDENDFYAQIKQTLWHEIAHYYGLGHAQMDALQGKPH